MRLIIQPNYQQLSCWAAAYVAKKINEFKPTAEKPFVLGLPTGGTPLGTYKELINLYNKGVVESAREHKPDYLRLSQAERELKEKERDFKIC